MCKLCWHIFAQYHQGDYKAACAGFTKAIELFRGPRMALRCASGLGCAGSLDKLDLAHACFERALQLDPDNACAGLGRCIATACA